MFLKRANLFLAAFNVTSPAKKLRFLVGCGLSVFRLEITDFRLLEDSDFASDIRFPAGIDSRNFENSMLFVILNYFKNERSNEIFS